MKKQFSYLDQLNAFFSWLEQNYLPSSAQLLWYTLMQLNNRAGWAEWFSVDNHRIKSITHINSTDTLVNNRNKLIEAGLINYRKGKKGRPAQYRIIPIRRNSQGLYCPELVSNTVENFDSKSESISEGISDTKPKNKIESKISTENQTINETISPTISETISPTINEISTIYNKTKTKTKTKTNIHTSKSEKKEKVDFNLLMNFWNEHCGNMSKLVKMTDARRKRIHVLLKEWSKEDLEKVILKAEASDFMNGITGDWKASFDWITIPKNFVKVLEGNYDNISAPKKQNTNIYDEGAEYLSLVSEGKININAEVIDEPTTNRATNYADEGIISGVVYEIDS